MGVADHPDRWQIEWTGGLLSGRRVTLRNHNTGQWATGHDWRDWDAAFDEAESKIESEGDLVTEVESFLEST